MTSPSNFQQSLDTLKAIKEDFEKTEKMSIDDIEAKFKAAQLAYDCCKTRINEVSKLIEQSKQG